VVRRYGPRVSAPNAACVDVRGPGVLRELLLRFETGLLESCPGEVS
jgi:hypothetical protein